MCATTLSRLIRWACAFAFAVAPMAAYAQAPATVLVACQNAGNCPTGGHNSPYADLQEAIDDAVADAVALDQQVLLMVVGGPWVGNYTIPADANVRMLGLTFNTQQTITIVPGTGGAPALGGTFTLSFTSPSDGSTDTTTALDFDATAAEVQTALEALTTIGTGNVTVTGPDGGPFDVNFTGALASVVVPIIVPDDTNLTPADAFVLVVSSDGPFSTIVQGLGTGPVLTIDGSTPESRDAGVARDRLIIEGLTFESGDQGIRVNGGTDPTAVIRPVLNRLYVRENGDGTGDSSGVLVEGAAAPLIVNSSISDNIGHGVLFKNGIAPSNSADFASPPDVLHCTIVRNSDNGIFVEQENNGFPPRVRNTIIYLNGTNQGEGGLVWEDNPFIDPDTGPLDGLDPGTGNPIEVTIFGTNLLEGGVTRVFFGPSVAAAEALNYGAQSDTQLDDVELPPAYNGIPGPVDVTIVRGDGSQIVIPDGFTYTSENLGADPVPVVWQVDPGWGPIDDVTTTGSNESAIDVYVLGAYFDRSCRVFFDFNDDGLGTANEEAPRIQWISPGRLFVRVPTRAVAGKVDVLVQNIPSGLISPKGPLEEYEYRAGFDTLGPDIFSIVPDRVDNTAGAGVTPDVFGQNFLPGVIVKIGGIVCPYVSLDTVGNDRINNITLPVSEFGGGGVYDVEVVNPDGRRDILPRAFAYFPDSTPRLDATPWRVSNFVEKGVGGSRTLLGHGLDFSVDIIADQVGTFGGPSTWQAGLQPTAQREIGPLPFPNASATILAGLPAERVPISVQNASATGSASSDFFSQTVNMFYLESVLPIVAGQGLYFEIQSATTTIGTPDQVTLQVRNFTNQTLIFVGPEPVTNIVSVVNTLPGIFLVTFDVPTPALEGVEGPVDIRLELPPTASENTTGETLYYILEDAYSYRRTGTGEFPQVSAVTPNTVPDNGPQTIQFTGQNFIGPVASGVYSRIWLDGDATFGNGNEVDLSAVAGAYAIDSISQITKVLDLDAVDPTIQIPRDVPVDVVVEQFDAVNGVVLTDGTNPLRSRLIGAITFRDLVAAPTITTITPNEGPVSGSDVAAFPVQILGTNFGVAKPIVLIGSSQANVTVWTPTTIDFQLPSAPNGLPGIYDVTVIRTDDFIEATLVDGFTYYMDGAPIVTELSPNHKTFDPANPPASPETIFITIYGYNFDDDVRITFFDNITAETDVLAMDDTTHPGRIRVISTTEIVVEITTTDLATILGATDYTAGVASLGVTVQNKADTVSTTDPDVLSLTSAPREPFFVFSDARGDMTVLMPVLLFNDVFENNQDNYVNVSPGSGSLSIDPVILTTPWLGKLLPDPVNHPLLDTAGTFSDGEPYTLTDFELEARPQDDGPEIGADEILDAFDLQICSWYYASVSPDPVGVMPPNQLLVDLRFNGNCGGTPFIVPQGGDPRNDADRIDLRLYQNPGNGYYIYTNEDAISTVLDDRDGNDRPSVGDLIADGHAAVYMERGSNIIGFDENATAPITYEASRVSDHLNEGGIIIDEAIEGRHFLIDTVPPRVHLEAYTAGATRAVDWLDVSVGGVVSSNDSITALDHNVATHPAGAPPAALPYRPSNAPPPFWHADNGIIGFKPIDQFIPNGLHLFFNHGSISNPDPIVQVNEIDFSLGATLDLVVVVQFIDPPVTDPEEDTQTPVPGLDFYTGRTNRQAAGFPFLTGADDAVEPAGGAAVDNILLQGAARWFPDPSVSITNGFAKTGQYLTDGNDGSVTPLFQDNIGVFNPNLVPGPAVPSPTATDDYDNDRLTATWTMAGLQPASIDQAWHVIAQFVGEDLALNATSTATTNTGADLYYDSFFFDPLHLWWMYKVESALTGPSNCENTATPFYTASLRGNRPSHTGEPFPAYTYQLWSSPVCEGPYTSPVFGTWRQWTISTSLDVLQDMQALLTPVQLAALNNQYIMIMLLGADEAGNVEPMPFDPATSIYDVNALPANVKTFRFSNQRPPETAVNLELWYDTNNNGIIDAGEPVFGDSPIVPYDPTLRARYAVSASSFANATSPVNAMWNFIRDGVRTQFFDPNDGLSTGGPIGQFQSESDVIPRVAPAAPATPGNPDIVSGPLGDANMAVAYLFTVASYYIDGTDTIRDPTPASAYFVVVPGGVGEFVTSPEDANKQPIKEQGRE